MERVVAQGTPEEIQLAEKSTGSVWISVPSGLPITPDIVARFPDRRKCACSASRRLIPWSDPMTDLQRSHAELRAAVILATKEICRLNSGSAVSPVLAKLRRVLRKSRTVAHDDRARIAMRIRLELPTDRKSVGSGKRV